MIPAQTAPAAPRFFQLRCALAYGAPLGVNGVILPYLPVWLDGLAFSEFEIGVVLAAQLLLRVFAAPVAGVFADRLSERTLMLAWSGALSLLTALAMFFTREFWPVLLIVGIQAAVFAPYAPIVEAIAVTGVRRWGFQYGSMRVWGSIGFVAVALVAGELRGLWGFQVIPPVITFGFLLTIAAAFAAPRLGRAVTRPDVGRGLQPSSLRRIDLHVLMIGASIGQASHGMFYTFGSIHWQQIGFSSGSIGVLWSAAVISEILVFFAGGWIARRVPWWTLMRVGCAVAALRWTLFPLPLGFWGYFALQCTHAFTFAFVHIGLQNRLVESVQEDQESSMQGAYVFYNGTFLALSTLLSGMIYREFGLASYNVMSLLSLIGLATIALAVRLQPQRLSSGG
ncbi:MFS transporter [Neorhizobium alkalisoli]|uniref:MFS transporter n=1 Tax=Neorhizobium alkalisoli TaxID=528178 RepID=UPI000CF98648|nr:MFS transporter [Neorhizobium alkalisoli]